MKLSDLRACIDAAIKLWGDRPITSYESFFAETPPREMEVRIQEAEIGLLAQYLDHTPRKWVTFSVLPTRGPAAGEKQGGKG